jgi:hypothetical protein
MTPSGILTVHAEPRFTTEMDILRRDGWDTCPAASARDEFDDLSWHLVVREGGCLVAMVRITMADRSLLSTWSVNQTPMPHGHDVAELTRAVVAAPRRRLGLYRLAMLETVLRLRALGARLATAAIEPDFPARPFLRVLGFAPAGEPVVFDDLPRSRTLAQPIVLAVDGRARLRWEEMRRAQLERLSDAGYVVESALGGSFVSTTVHRPYPRTGALPLSARVLSAAGV